MTQPHTADQHTAQQEKRQHQTSGCRLQPLEEDWGRLLAVVRTQTTWSTAPPRPCQVDQPRRLGRIRDRHRWGSRHRRNEPDDAGPVRRAEQLVAAVAVGVSDVTFLGLSDGVVEYGLPLRRAIAAEIRRTGPTCC